MPFNGISYLELLQILCSAECYHLRDFGKENNEKQFCELILNLSQWFSRRCRLKDSLYGALAVLLFE